MPEITMNRQHSNIDRGLAPKIDLSVLSPPAKAAASMFAMMLVFDPDTLGDLVAAGRDPPGGLSFMMREARPSSKMQEALDELVEKKVVICHKRGPGRGVVYLPIVDCWPAHGWLGKNLDDPDIRFPVTLNFTKEFIDGRSVREMNPRLKVLRNPYPEGSEQASEFEAGWNAYEPIK